MAKKSLKTHILEVQGRSRSSMLVPPESSPAVLVMIRSKSVSIGNHSRARLVDSSRNRTFLRGYPNLMRSYGALLEPRGWKLALLKSTFNAENFICRLSWSISSDFDAGHRCWYRHCHCINLIIYYSGQSWKPLHNGTHEPSWETASPHLTSVTKRLMINEMSGNFGLLWAGGQPKSCRIA